jgi:TolB-like protein/class 3 adenylate cyclase
MNSPSEPASPLEIGHVLFIDIVGYSRLLSDDQRQKVQRLNEIVRQTEQFRAADAADRLLRLPTGDGVVLVFFTTPDAPARCALEIDHAARDSASLPLRMGIHSGPVDQITDLSGRPNLTGAGINLAQRVMDCGDAGHILLSARAAHDLAEYTEWQAQLHPLGEVEVKHGAVVEVVSLHNEDVGNPKLPSRIARARVLRRRRLIITLGAAAVLLALAAGGWWLRQRALRAATAAAMVKGVAVLPFEALGKDPDNAIFADGVQREVLSNLAKIADLKVISRSSVMKFKPGAERNLKQIAEQLSVAYLVEGTVERAGNHVRVNAELIDADTESVAWSQDYDGDLVEVISFQAQIAQRITNQLGAKLSPRESTELAARPTRDIAAFESYIRARTLLETDQTDDDPTVYRDACVRAAALLEQTVARDPHFVAAFWALSEANIQLFRSSDGDHPEYRARAEAALQEASRLAPNAGETLLARSRVIYYGYRDFSRALSVLEDAAKLLPNSAEVTMTRALLYRRFGRWQEAFAQFLRATELNPEDPSGFYSAASAAINLRWWDDCDEVRKRLIKVFPRFRQAAQIEGAVSLRLRGDVAEGDKELEHSSLDVHSDFVPFFYMAMWQRDYVKAGKILEEAARGQKVDARDLWEQRLRFAFVTRTTVPKEEASLAEKEVEDKLAHTLPNYEDGSLANTLIFIKFALGKREEAVRMAEDEVRKHPVTKDSISNVDRLRWLAFVYVFAGDKERAIQTFSELVRVPGGIFYGPLKYDPLLDDLRGDPRFDEIVKQSKIPFPRVQPNRT